jgi:hypothetical protein
MVVRSGQRVRAKRGPMINSAASRTMRPASRESWASSFETPTVAFGVGRLLRMRG